MHQYPFVYGRSVKNQYFTDREQESRWLENNFRNGVNTILISPRRIGKTSLVEKVCRKFSDSPDIKIVLLDIFKCRNEEEFFRTFSDNVLRQTSSKMEEWVENAKSFLSRLSPKVNISADPTSPISLGFELSSTGQFAEDILSLPLKIAAKKKCRLIICIDEFQQIGEFKDSMAFQKLLRTYWQHQDDVTYCLFGSKKHMMNELFEKPSNPFYKFGEVINLKKIPEEYWIEFIKDRFHKTGKEIQTNTAKEICRLTENYSCYVQQLSLILWDNFDPKNQLEALKFAFDKLLEHCGVLFEQQTINLSAYQMNFLRALVDGHSENLSTSAIISKYELGSTSNIQRIKTALIKKELIDIEERRYVITDPILKAWLRRLFYQ
ncbi:MAG: ATP-binding protein [Muribaculaceae bacterium]|nr:ATP-binding protein [Muribaculaceae bacterium]